VCSLKKGIYPTPRKCSLSVQNLKNRFQIYETFKGSCIGHTAQTFQCETFYLREIFGDSIKYLFLDCGTLKGKDEKQMSRFRKKIISYWWVIAIPFSCKCIFYTNAGVSLLSVYSNYTPHPRIAYIVGYKNISFDIVFGCFFIKNLMYAD